MIQLVKLVSEQQQHEVKAGTVHVPKRVAVPPQPLEVSLANIGVCLVVSVGEQRDAVR